MISAGPPPYPILIFVYNADGGVLSALSGMIHKIISPSTYPCSLCALTHGPFAKRREWQDFFAHLRPPKQVLYRDAFHADPGLGDIPLPAILLRRETGPPTVLVSAAELNALPDLEALMALIAARLEPAQG